MPLKNRKLIVTGGPTREWLDPVRYISNASSGKMGVAIADESFARGADTVFIHGPMQEAVLAGREYRCVSIESTSDLLEAVKAELAPNAVLIMAAAPADYAPEEKSDKKIKKNSDELVIRLKKNPDILKNVAAIRKNNFSLSTMFVVGFAAETHNIEAYALNKLEEKNLDLICVNDVSRAGAGFNVDTNIITIFTRNRERLELPLLSKQDAAGRILDCVEKGLEKLPQNYLE